MDPLIIHHVIRHPLSRMKTSNFQDKSGCSINGFRSFLFEQGIVQNLDDMDTIINSYNTMQDYRGYILYFGINYFHKFHLSGIKREVILKTKTKEKKYTTQAMIIFDHFLSTFFIISFPLILLYEFQFLDEMFQSIFSN